MSKIYIVREHQLSPKEIHKHIEQLTEQLQESLEVEAVREGDRILFKRSGASGFIRVDDQQIEVEVALGLIYRPLRKRIEHTILTYLDDYFA